MLSLETTKTPKLLLLWDRMGDYHLFHSIRLPFY